MRAELGPYGPKLRVYLIGEGPERPAIERYLARHELGDTVVLTGRRSREEIRDLYVSEVDAYLAPANLESFGIAALEARCAGVPVVAKAHTGVREFVRHGVEGLLATDDRDMVAQLVRLGCDRELRADIAKHNASTTTGLDWTEVVPRTLAVYQRAIERRADG